MEYISDWSSVPINRYEQAQKSENEYWSLQDHRVLTLHSQYYFYAGYYEWTKHRALINPFCVRPSRPQNFQIPGNAVKGKAILDIGCGPMSPTISLVHCAKVHVVDSLVDFYKTIQPFGWEFFTSVSAVGAEQLLFDKHTFHFVHCWNVLDHTKMQIRFSVRLAESWSRVASCCSGVMLEVNVVVVRLTPISGASKP